MAYHRVREAVASDLMDFYHIPGENNPADILSKHWGFQQVWPLLKAVLFWQGDTSNIKDAITTLKQLNTLSIQSIEELWNESQHEHIKDILNPYGTESPIKYVINSARTKPHIWKFE